MKTIIKLFLVLSVISVLSIWGFSDSVKKIQAANSVPIRSWIKLGNVAYEDPASDAEYLAGKIDWFDGPTNSLLAALKPLTNAPAVTYDEYRSVWDGYKLGEMQKWIAAHPGVVEEDMYMHFSEDTVISRAYTLPAVSWIADGSNNYHQVITLNGSQTQSPNIITFAGTSGVKKTAPLTSTSVDGDWYWNIATKTLSIHYAYKTPSLISIIITQWLYPTNSRVPAGYLNLLGSVINPGNANAVAWMKDYIAGPNSIVVKDGYDGTFVDNTVPLALLKSVNNDAGAVVSGGHYKEFSNVDRNISAKSWDTAMVAMAGQIKSELAAKGKTQQVANEAQMLYREMDPSITGIFRENFLYQIAYSSTGNPITAAFTNLQNMLIDDASKGLNTYVSTGSTLFIGRDGYPNVGSQDPVQGRLDRHEFTLALYYLLATERSYFGLQDYNADNSFGPTRTNGYTPMVEADIGTAQGPATRWDTDASPYLYGRQFTKGLVLMNISDFSDRDRISANTYSLGGTYFRVQKDGTISTTPITSINLKHWEGAILIRVAPNISLIKSVDKTVAKSGDILTYTINYSNSGNAIATAAKIEDPLPIGTTFVSSTGGGTLNSGKVSWSLPNITVGGNGTVTFQVRVN